MESDTNIHRVTIEQLDSFKARHPAAKWYISESTCWLSYVIVLPNKAQQTYTLFADDDAKPVLRRRKVEEEYAALQEEEE